MDLTPRAEQEGCHFVNQWNLNFWKAPEDPDRPLLPYLPGFSVQILRHVGELEDLALEQRPKLPEGYLRSVTHSEAVVANLTVEEIRGPSSQAETAQLVITSPIAIGSARGAQVVACNVTMQDGHPFVAAAKIYDPLYYSFEHSIGHFPRDCVDEADHDFLVESWAYENLEKAGETGSSAPEYYGSWTFTLPIVVKGKPIARPVRLILIERLNGASIQGSRIQNSYNRSSGTDAFHFPEGFRMEVLARAMDGYVKQMAIGVEQGDFTGRNIILVSDEFPTTHSERICGLALPRVVLIDYNNANVSGHSSNELDPTPMNPAMQFWGPYLWVDIAGWVPYTWEKGKFQQDWLLRRFCKHGQRELYRPIPEWMDLLVKQQHPGPQRDCSGHASNTAISSPRSGEADSKTSPSRSDGSDDGIQTGTSPVPVEHSSSGEKIKIINGSLFGSWRDGM